MYILNFFFCFFVFIVARGFTARSFCRSLAKSRKLLRAAIAARDVSSAQEILQRVKRRTGKRVGFLLEQQQVQKLVDQARQRQKLKEVIEEAKKRRANKSSKVHPSFALFFRWPGICYVLQMETHSLLFFWIKFTGRR